MARLTGRAQRVVTRHEAPVRSRESCHSTKKIRPQSTRWRSRTISPALVRSRYRRTRTHALRGPCGARAACGVKSVSDHAQPLLPGVKHRAASAAATVNPSAARADAAWTDEIRRLGPRTTAAVGTRDSHSFRRRPLSLASNCFRSRAVDRPGTFNASSIPVGAFVSLWPSVPPLLEHAYQFAPASSARLTPHLALSSSRGTGSDSTSVSREPCDIKRFSVGRGRGAKSAWCYRD